ncbi:D-xylulose kinase [Herbaspirillum rubrisubalbicans M1]|uniref:xylulokinase n=1 Tax=Herbaspirillum rubrisubalbicans TaxID=80842 RepID=UPI00073A51F9|nr:xylulokinase [Herbaspirillum rubrisubalbicans]ALU90576.1 D-xylulose kinase [Herbaspirillum rubrisubalbicans M1]
MSYLGIDLGTSEVKLVLTDPDSNIIATRSARLRVDHPHPLWSEQAPQAWWNATLDAIATLRATAPQAFQALRGIGISGQMHGATLLDRNGNVLRPAILWNDMRAHAECVELEALVPDAADITGNRAMPGFTAPKLLWLSKYEPAVYRAIDKVLLPKDYLGWKLTGEFVSEMSDAAGTLWLDVARRDWSERMLHATGLSRSHMPRLVEGSAVAGHLREDLRREWGISAPVVVAGGAGDNAASAVGIGVIQAGDAFLSLGSSGVLFAATAQHAPNPQQGVHAFCHCLPGQWHQMSVILSAAASLHWLAGVLGREVPELVSAAERLTPEQQAQAPLFLPYLNGERTPHNDAAAKGVLFGMTSAHEAAHLAYAVMEGVAFAMADGYAALQAAGTVLHSAAFVGGGSRSAFWGQLCATALGIPLRHHAGAEVGAALGAARLGRLAQTGEDVRDVCVAPEVLERYAPDQARQSQLMRRLEQYRRLYPCLAPEFFAFSSP